MEIAQVLHAWVSVAVWHLWEIMHGHICFSGVKNEQKNSRLFDQHPHNKTCADALSPCLAYELVMTGHRPSGKKVRSTIMGSNGQPLSIVYFDCMFWSWSWAITFATSSAPKWGPTNEHIFFNPGIRAEKNETSRKKVVHFFVYQVGVQVVQEKNTSQKSRKIVVHVFF